MIRGEYSHYPFLSIHRDIKVRQHVISRAFFYFRLYPSTLRLPHTILHPLPLSSHTYDLNRIYSKTGAIYSAHSYPLSLNISSLPLMGSPEECLEYLFQRQLLDEVPTYHTSPTNAHNYSYDSSQCEVDLFYQESNPALDHHAWLHPSPAHARLTPSFPDPNYSTTVTSLPETCSFEELFPNHYLDHLASFLKLALCDSLPDLLLTSPRSHYIKDLVNSVMDSSITPTFLPLPPHLQSSPIPQLSPSYSALPIDPTLQSIFTMDQYPYQLIIITHGHIALLYRLVPSFLSSFSLPSSSSASHHDSSPPPPIPCSASQLKSSLELIAWVNLTQLSDFVGINDIDLINNQLVRTFLVLNATTGESQGTANPADNSQNNPSIAHREEIGQKCLESEEVDENVPPQLASIPLSIFSALPSIPVDSIVAFSTQYLPNERFGQIPFHSEHTIIPTYQQQSQFLPSRNSSTFTSPLKPAVFPQDSPQSFILQSNRFVCEDPTHIGHSLAVVRSNSKYIEQFLKESMKFSPISPTMVVEIEGGDNIQAEVDSIGNDPNEALGTSHSQQQRQVDAQSHLSQTQTHVTSQPQHSHTPAQLPHQPTTNTYIASAPQPEHTCIEFNFEQGCTTSSTKFHHPLTSAASRSQFNSSLKHTPYPQNSLQNTDSSQTTPFSSRSPLFNPDSIHFAQLTSMKDYHLDTITALFRKVSNSPIFTQPLSSPSNLAVPPSNPPTRPNHRMTPQMKAILTHFLSSLPPPLLFPTPSKALQANSIYRINMLFIARVQNEIKSFVLEFFPAFSYLQQIAAFVSIPQSISAIVLPTYSSLVFSSLYQTNQSISHDLSEILKNDPDITPAMEITGQRVLNSHNIQTNRESTAIPPIALFSTFSSLISSLLSTLTLIQLVVSSMETPIASSASTSTTPSVTFPLPGFLSLPPSWASSLQSFLAILLSLVAPANLSSNHLLTFIQAITNQNTPQSIVTVSHPGPSTPLAPSPSSFPHNTQPTTNPPKNQKTSQPFAQAGSFPFFNDSHIPTISHPFVLLATILVLSKHNLCSTSFFPTLFQALLSPQTLFQAPNCNPNHSVVESNLSSPHLSNSITFFLHSLHTILPLIYSTPLSFVSTSTPQSTPNPPFHPYQQPKVPLLPNSSPSLPLPPAFTALLPQFSFSIFSFENPFDSPTILDTIIDHSFIHIISLEMHPITLTTHTTDHTNEDGNNQRKITTPHLSITTINANTFAFISQSKFPLYLFLSQHQLTNLPKLPKRKERRTGKERKAKEPLKNLAETNSHQNSALESSPHLITAMCDDSLIGIDQNNTVDGIQGRKRTLQALSPSTSSPNEVHQDRPAPISTRRSIRRSKLQPLDSTSDRLFDQTSQIDGLFDSPLSNLNNSAHRTSQHQPQLPPTHSFRRFAILSQSQTQSQSAFALSHSHYSRDDRSTAPFHDTTTAAPTVSTHPLRFRHSQFGRSQPQCYDVDVDVPSQFTHQSLMSAQPTFETEQVDPEYDVSEIDFEAIEYPNYEAVVSNNGLLSVHFDNNMMFLHHVTSGFLSTFPTVCTFSANHASSDPSTCVVDCLQDNKAQRKTDDCETDPQHSMFQVNGDVDLDVAALALDSQLDDVAKHIHANNPTSSHIEFDDLTINKYHPSTTNLSPPSITKHFSISIAVQTNDPQSKHDQKYANVQTNSAFAICANSQLPNSNNVSLAYTSGPFLAISVTEQFSSPHIDLDPKKQLDLDDLDDSFASQPPTTSITTALERKSTYTIHLSQLDVFFQELIIGPQLTNQSSHKHTTPYPNSTSYVKMPSIMSQILFQSQTSSDPFSIDTMLYHQQELFRSQHGQRKTQDTSKSPLSQRNSIISPIFAFPILSSPRLPTLSLAQTLALTNICYRFFHHDTDNQDINPVNDAEMEAGALDFAIPHVNTPPTIPPHNIPTTACIPPQAIQARLQHSLQLAQHALPRTIDAFNNISHLDDISPHHTPSTSGRNNHSINRLIHPPSPALLSTPSTRNTTNQRYLNTVNRYNANRQNTTPSSTLAFSTPHQPRPSRTDQPFSIQLTTPHNESNISNNSHPNTTVNDHNHSARGLNQSNRMRLSSMNVSSFSTPSATLRNRVSNINPPPTNDSLITRQAPTAVTDSTINAPTIPAARTTMPGTTSPTTPFHRLTTTGINDENIDQDVGNVDEFGEFQSSANTGELVQVQSRTIRPSAVRFTPSTLPSPAIPRQHSSTTASRTYRRQNSDRNNQTIVERIHSHRQKQTAADNNQVNNGFDDNMEDQSNYPRIFMDTTLSSPRHESSISFDEGFDPWNEAATQSTGIDAEIKFEISDDGDSDSSLRFNNDHDALERLHSQLEQDFQSQFSQIHQHEDDRAIPDNSLEYRHNPVCSSHLAPISASRSASQPIRNASANSSSGGTQQDAMNPSNPATRRRRVRFGQNEEEPGNNQTSATSQQILSQRIDPPPNNNLSAAKTAHNTQSLPFHLKSQHSQLFDENHPLSQSTIHRSQKFSQLTQISQISQADNFVSDAIDTFNLSTNLANSHRTINAIPNNPHSSSLQQQQQQQQQHTFSQLSQLSQSYSQFQPLSQSNPHFHSRVYQAELERFQSYLEEQQMLNFISFLSLEINADLYKRQLRKSSRTERRKERAKRSLRHFQSNSPLVAQDSSAGSAPYSSIHSTRSIHHGMGSHFINPASQHSQMIQFDGDDLEMNTKYPTHHHPQSDIQGQTPQHSTLNSFSLPHRTVLNQNFVSTLSSTTSSSLDSPLTLSNHHSDNPHLVLQFLTGPQFQQHFLQPDNQAPSLHIPPQHSLFISDFTHPTPLTDAFSTKSIFKDCLPDFTHPPQPSSNFSSFAIYAPLPPRLRDKVKQKPSPLPTSTNLNVASFPTFHLNSYGHHLPKYSFLFEFRSAKTIKATFPKSTSSVHSEFPPSSPPTPSPGSNDASFGYTVDKCADEYFRSNSDPNFIESISTTPYHDYSNTTLITTRLTSTFGTNLHARRSDRFNFPTSQHFLTLPQTISVSNSTRVVVPFGTFPLVISTDRGQSLALQRKVQGLVPSSADHFPL